MTKPSENTISVVDLDGVISDELSVSTSTTNSFKTKTPYHVIGGFELKGFNYIQVFYEFNQGPGPGGAGNGSESVSITFTLHASSTIVVFGMASGQQVIQFSGISKLYVDIPSANSTGKIAMSIVHAYLGPGTYTITQNSYAITAWWNPKSQADLIGLIICSNAPNAGFSKSPKLPIPKW